MKRISIETNRPILDITSRKAQLNIENKIRSFNMKSKPAAMKSNPKGATFKVDWAKVRSESGLRTPERQMEAQRQESVEYVQQGISKIVSSGNYVVDLQNYQGGTDPFAQVSVNNMESEMPDINVASMPENLPNVEWDAGGLNIEWEQGNVKIDWEQEYMPNITITPHSVEIRLQGEAGVKISVNEDNLAPTIGKQLNRVI